MRMRMLALASTALITTLVLAGCGQNNDPGMSGMDHGSSSSSPSSSEASADFNAADEMFVTMMITMYSRIIVKLTYQQSFYCFVYITITSTIQRDACCCQSILSARADTTTN